MNRFVIVTLGCLAVSPVLADGMAESQARLGEITGTVQVLTQGAHDWIDAHIDLPLDPGDQIRVEDDSSVELSLAKNVLLILGGNSEIVMGRTTTQEGSLTLVRGALVGKLERDEGPAGEWEFSTPLAVCSVRGTEFAIDHSDEQGTHLGVFKGMVQMRAAESAAGNFPAEVINAHEEGVAMKRQPLKKLKAYSPVIRKQFGPANALQKRYPRFTGVWVPMTTDYRTELRHKYVAKLSPRKTAPRPVRRQRRVER